MDVFSNTNTESVRQQEDKTSSGLFGIVLRYVQ